MTASANVPGTKDLLTSSRFHGLDCLRICAALAVVLFHFTARDHSRWGDLPYEVFPVMSGITRYGYLGVHLFFVISGYVILMSAWGRSTGAFVASRVGRLYPAYWTAVLLTAGLRAVWPGFETRTPGQVAVNLTMLQEPFGVPLVDGVYWTLWVELQFYVLVAVAVRLRLSLRALTVGAVLVPACAVLLLVANPAADDTFSALGWLPLFGVGMLLCVIHREGSTVVRWALVLVDTGMACGMAVWRHAGAIDLIAGGPSTSAVVLAGGVLVVIALVGLAVLRPRAWRWSARWAARAGALTYPLYLTHEYVGWALIDGLHPRTGRWITLAVAVVVCLALAWTVHVGVERRVGRRLRVAVERWLTPAGRQVARAR